MSARSSAGAAEAAAEKIPPFPEAAIADHWNTLRPYLERWASAGTLPPVLLLKGLPGIGKRVVATKLAQWVLCERGPLRKNREREQAEDEGPSLFGDLMPAAEPEPVDGAASAADPLEPCGVCTSCVPFRTGRNVNFTALERDEESRSLKIEHFREWKEKLGYGGFDSPFRVYLIPDADDFTVQAANSVLKLFEEPPTGWFFFLTSSDPARIPITILSRSQAIGLAPISENAIRDSLRRSDASADPADIETLTHLSQGSLTRAAEFRRIDSGEKTRHLLAIFRGDGEAPGHLYDWLVNQPDAIGLVMDLVETFLVDLVTLATGVDRDLFHAAYRAEFLEFLAVPGAAARVMERLERLQELRRLLLTNVNAKLVFAEVGLLLRF